MLLNGRHKGCAKQKRCRKRHSATPSMSFPRSRFRPLLVTETSRYHHAMPWLSLLLLLSAAPQSEAASRFEAAAAFLVCIESTR